MIKLEKYFDWSNSMAKDLFEKHMDPALILNRLKDFLIGFSSSLPRSEFTEIHPLVFVHKTAFIHDSCFLNGPAIIGPGAELRYNVYLRGPALIDAKVTLANSTEIKNAILLESATCPHYNYVGDSILGCKSHLGAGVICSNLRSDRQNIIIKHKGGTYDTGRHKFGALIGDRTEVGCQSVLNPGTVLGPDSRVYPLTSVLGVYGPGSLIGQRPEPGEDYL